MPRSGLHLAAATETNLILDACSTGESDVRQFDDESNNIAMYAAALSLSATCAATYFPERC
ncbi:hypothetical protein [Deinococcus sonorensis]|uniref:Uncharacterized protein n=2 Tax=Deinococcus sonorensis TaxID=309891 RepID=A0AAU7UB91_9DEIO